MQTSKTLTRNVTKNFGKKISIQNPVVLQHNISTINLYQSVGICSFVNVHVLCKFDYYLKIQIIKNLL
jgi:hypothetical protein